MLLVSTVWSLFSDGKSVSGTAMPDVVQTNLVEREEFEVILDTRGASAVVEPATQGIQFGCGPQVF